jgi:hypothetical protein
VVLWAGHSLDRHKVGPLPLPGLALVGGAFAWCVARRGGPSPAHAGLAGLIMWALAGIGLWARCQGYLWVRAEEVSPPIHVPAPSPDERLPLRAGDLCGVMYKERESNRAQVAAGTLDAGERVIMAYAPHSRFRLLGQWVLGEVGWWYIFMSRGAVL